MKCKLCLMNYVWDIHNTGRAKYCLDCKLNLRKPKKGSLQGIDRTREKVRVRDNHTCQDCSKKWVKGQRRFDCHHLYGLCGKKSNKYDKVSEIGGMITLCHKCHFNRPEHKTKLKVIHRNRQFDSNIINKL